MVSFSEWKRLPTYTRNPGVEKHDRVVYGSLRLGPAGHNQKGTIQCGEEEPTV